jgi:hypothetical protein
MSNFLLKLLVQMDIFPVEIWKYIRSFLEGGDIICLRHTSKLFICLKSPKLSRNDIIEDLIRYDRTELIEYFTSMKLPDHLKYKLSYRMIRTAVWNGSLNIIKKIVKGNYKKDSVDIFHDGGLCYMAATRGYFDCLRFLYENNYEISTHTLLEAICHCNTNAVKWLITKCEIKPTEQHIVQALEYGKLNTLKYLLSLKIKIKYTDICLSAIQCGRFGIFEWLVKHGYLRDRMSIYSDINNEELYTTGEKAIVINILEANK